MSLDKFSLNGKVAIVTGAGRGIGKGVALAFAQAGADVVCVARTVSQIEATAAEVRTLGRKALAIPCDTKDATQIDHMVKTTRDKLGGIDIMVNNAGHSGVFTPALETSESAWNEEIRENLTSVFLCTKAAAKVMREKKAGSIVNIASRQSDMPAPGSVGYGAAKAGVKSLTMTFAFELAPHIRVNAIQPGGIWTEGAAPFLEPAKDLILKSTPMRRFGMRT
ncbi:MAG: SDR family oxidoreductase [Chloroflexi bacterium]|nr:SDR family oxidoreductase [Chloroflexota bacterium]